MFQVKTHFGITWNEEVGPYEAQSAEHREEDVGSKASIHDQRRRNETLQKSVVDCFEH